MIDTLLHIALDKLCIGARRGIAALAVSGIAVWCTVAHAQTPIDLSISEFSRTYVQKAYVAYYGRPADPAGLNYWGARMDSEGQSLAAIIGAFGNSAEFNGRYGGLSNSALVTKIYQQALARDPDPAGLAYYVGELAAGRKTLQSITLDVLGGASTAPDSITVANKLDVAAFYTDRVAAGCAYGTELTGVTALAGVNATPATVNAAKSAIDARCGTVGGGIDDDLGLKQSGISPPPPMSIVPERPISGNNVVVKVTIPGALSISLAKTGSGCGALTAANGGSPLTVTGKVAENGFCDLTATATLPGGATKVLIGHFEIQATHPDLPPVTPEGGIFIQRRFPTATPGGPTIASINGPPGFVNGGSGIYEIAYGGTRPVATALVRVPGYEGYYRAPIYSTSGTVSLRLDFASDYFAPVTSARATQQRARMQQAGAGGSLDLHISLEDEDGKLGGEFELDLTPKQVNSGEVKISVAWDTPTDVDLHVFEPSNEEIFYDHKESATGGKLDLDSNPSCVIDGINNENVFWPDGKSPTGNFHVRVHMFRSGCGLPQGPFGAKGAVTITYCGADSPKVLPFTLPGTASRQDFFFSSACNLRVKGTVRYEDFPVTDTGLGAGALMPVRYARVQVWRVKPGGDEIIAQGDTDRTGKYDISFANDDPQHAGFYVQVIAWQVSPRVRQVVRNLDGDMYAFRSPKAGDPPLNANNPPAGNTFQVDINVMKSDGAGALNIFDVGLDSASYVKAYTGTTPPMITWKWTPGADPNGLGVSYFSKSSDVIFVLSSAADPDEYDDVVLAHEYGHFIMSKFSASDSAGGPHSSHARSFGSLAWSEGWATFFALASQKRTSYVDTNATGLGVFHSLETLPASIPLGNENDQLSGRLSEAIVSAVLLDLHDGTNEANDTLSDKSTSIWRVFTTYLAKSNTKYVDRGAYGRDLVDFLDGWFCLGLGDMGADDTQGMRGIVKGLHQLSYDFPALPACE